MLQAEKNLILEEKITVLQQQNEELRARIEHNTVITRFDEMLVLYLSLHRGCKFELPKAGIYFRKRRIKYVSS